MKTLLKFEEIAKVILAFALSIYIGFEWWVFLVLLFVPDLSMIGYAVNSQVGAIIYNLFHHQFLAIAIGLTGLFIGSSELQLAGLVLFGHSAMDRTFGFGLKYQDGFKHTHLGVIGDPKSQV